MCPGAELPPPWRGAIAATKQHGENKNETMHEHFSFRDGCRIRSRRVRLTPAAGTPALRVLPVDSRRSRGGFSTASEFQSDSVLKLPGV
jgi:hypothetical protein